LKDKNLDPLEKLEKAMRAQARETDYPGLEIDRSDGILLARNNLTAEEHGEWRRNAAVYRETLPESILKQAEEIERIILQYDPLDTIAHVAWINALHDAEHWDEHQFEGNDVYTEYIALLCLTHKLEDFDAPTVESSMGPNIEDIQDSIKQLFQMSALEDQLEPTVLEGDPTRADQLRFMTLLHELGVRYPGSSQHLHEILGELLDPLSNEMRAALGFDIKQAIALDRAILTHLNERLGQRIQKAKEFEKDLHKAVKRYRQKRRVDNRFDAKLISGFAALRPSESAERIRRSAIMWLYFAFGQTLSFTAAELAQVASVSEAEAQAFLDFHSVQFGKINQRFRLPRPTHPLQIRPIIKSPNEEGASYFCPVWQAVSWALRPRLEEWLGEKNDNESTFRMTALYEARRSDYCEQKAFDLVASLLRPARGSAYRSAKYRTIVNGEEREFEIDGVFLLGSVLVLLEVKSGGVRPSARRGGIPSMKSSLQVLIGDAAAQTSRAWEYLSTSDSPILSVNGGRSWRVPVEQVCHIFRICVTLEDLTAFATNIHVLENMGLINLETPFWAVSIYDLMVLKDLIHLPGLFIHYLSRRYAIEQMGHVHAYSELDYFGSYLTEGLMYDKIPKDKHRNVHIMLDPTYSSIIDNWYYFLEGARRTQPQKPERNIPLEFRAVLEALEEKRPEKYLEVSCMLLDLPDAIQTELASDLGQMRVQCNADNKTHDVTIIPPGWNLGITIMASSDKHVDELARSLNTYCLLKKYQQHRGCWIGLGSISWAHEPVQIVMLFDEPWRQNPEMDDLVRKSLPPGAIATI